ncbi:VapC toxin family PIN domain ribonuclease, partial [Rhizobium leguminosarum]
DGYIAATAVANGLAVATRDTGPFEAVGLKVINPWAPINIR